jgi:uncharacterized protein (TIGR03118 family)
MFQERVSIKNTKYRLWSGEIYRDGVIQPDWYNSTIANRTAPLYFRAFKIINHSQFMYKNYLKSARLLQSMFGLSVLLFLVSCGKIPGEFPGHGGSPGNGNLGNLKQVNLVANNESYGAKRVDPLLLNAWGLSFGITGLPWISSPNSGISTIYDKDGAFVFGPINIPGPGGPTGGTPTGQVANTAGPTFILPNGEAASFLFANLDGVISGWNAKLGLNAIPVINNVGQAVYTGLAMAIEKGGANYLYAANALKGTVDVFDWAFRPVTDRKFADPTLPAGYVPFNVHVLGEYIFVTYSKVGANGRALKEVGNGVVNVFTKGGVYVNRFAEGGKLNAPWGVAAAPASFFPGKEAQAAILIGNFGDGKINAYTPEGKFISQLKVNNQIVAIDGLWEITFPPTTSIIDQNRLYFTAGPADERDGLFGYLIK